MSRRPVPVLILALTLTLSFGPTQSRAAEPTSERHNTDILTHCRGNGPHVRGCWVVDLVLGKE